MTDNPINDHSLQTECDTLAREIFNDILADMEDDETPDHHRDAALDRIHETVDGHQWVIYYRYAHQICANCNTDEGEAFLEDIGAPDPVTYDSLGTTIAFGEMRYRVSAALETLIEKYEPEGEDA